jgi:hypothetical protein
VLLVLEFEGKHNSANSKAQTSKNNKTSLPLLEWPILKHVVHVVVVVTASLPWPPWRGNVRVAKARVGACIAKQRQSECDSVISNYFIRLCKVSCFITM